MTPSDFNPGVVSEMCSEGKREWAENCGRRRATVNLGFLHLASIARSEARAFADFRKRSFQTLPNPACL
jgi:hypothetical protein